VKTNRSVAIAMALLSAQMSLAQRPNSRRPEQPVPPQSVPRRQPTTPVIRFVLRSTIKLEQLVGEEDKELHKPTLSQTVTRYQLQGTDLGYSFANNESIYFLFGDTVGVLDKARDTLATTNVRLRIG
jgi:hypothetical protein